MSSVYSPLGILNKQRHLIIEVNACLALNTGATWITLPQYIPNNDGCTVLKFIIFYLTWHYTRN